MHFSSPGRVLFFSSFANQLDAAVHFANKFILWTTNYLQDVDTALIKLYCKGHLSKLVSFVTSSDLLCDEEDCLNALRSAERHHASALLLLKMKRFEEAFGIWTQLIKKSLTDEHFPGLDCFIDHLVM